MRNLFSFEGTINRKIFLAIYLVTFLTSALINLAYKELVANNDDFYQFIFVCLFLPFAFVQIAAFVKRCRDIGISTWYTLIGFLPIVGFLFVAYLAIKPSKNEKNLV